MLKCIFCLRCAQHFVDECLCPEIIQYRLAMAKEELEDKDIGEWWRRYRPLVGRDDQADLVVALVRKLVVQGARNIPYGNWQERLSHPLTAYRISLEEWDDGS